MSNIWYKEDYIKVNKMVVIYVLIAITLNILLTIGCLVSSGNSSATSDKEVIKSGEFGNIIQMYSSCSHDWRILDNTKNDWRITVSCSKCGTIQVVNVSKDSLYINKLK